MRSIFRDEPGDPFSRKALIALILPLIAEQFLAVLVGMADTVMVSGVGDSAVAAISTVDTINLLFIQMFSAMSAGGAVVVAQYLGHHDIINARGAARQLMLSTLILSTTLMILSLVFYKQVIRIMDDGRDWETTQQCYTYLLITACSFPFLGIYNGGISLLRAMGNSKASMWTSIAMNCINIGGNALLIHPCGLGVAGAAISTLVSRAASAIIILKMTLNQQLIVHIPSPVHHMKDYKPDKEMILRIMHIGLPNGIEGSSFQIGKVMIMSIITTFPTALRAANGICDSVFSVVNIPGTAIGLASITVIGQLIGANDKEMAKRYGLKLSLLMNLGILPLNLILLLFAQPIISLFHLSSSAIPMTVTITRMYAALSILTWMPSFGLPNVLRAAGDTRYAMTVSMVSMLLLRVGASYLLVYHFGLSLLGVWIAMHMDWIARGSFFIGRFIRGKWMNKRAIE